MRRRPPLAFAGLFVVVLAAVLGFASFTARAPEPDAPQMTDGVGLSSYVSGRLTAAVLSSRLRGSLPESSAAAVGNGIETTGASAIAPVNVRTPEPATTTETVSSSSRPESSTTAAPTPSTTSTTTPPATLPPVTRPPTTFPPDVERWRPLVATYFPTDLLDEALSVMECESRGDPDAENPFSTASGLYQFIASTWNWASANAGFTGVSVFDPEANIATAAFLVEYSVDRGLPAWQHWVCQPDIGS